MFKHFTSLTLFPKGNQHFISASHDYLSFLKKSDNNFIAIVYEEFFSLLKDYTQSSRYLNWITYLVERYIVD